MDPLPFDLHYQKHFLNHLLRDSEFLSIVQADVSPELFSNETIQRLVRVLTDYAKEHKAAPGTLVFRLLDSWKEGGRLSENLHKELSTFSDELFQLPLQNRSFLLKEFSNFARQQMIKAKMPQFIESVRKNKFDDAEDTLREVFLYRPNSKSDLGGRFDPDPTSRILRRQVEDVRRAWTLIPEIDTRIDGLKGGELGIFQSQKSSAGKSAALQLLVRSFVFQGFKVLVYTLEMGKESWEDRLDMCVTGVTRDGLLDRMKITKAMRNMFRFGGDIWIAKFPMYLTKLSQLRAHSLMLANVHNFRPDILVVDYLDLICPESGVWSENLYATGAEVYGNFVGWLQEEDFIGWSAAQSGRGAMDATFADQQHIGGSIAKAQIAHLILSINRTDEEVKQGLTNIRVVKNREGGANYPIVIQSDFAKMAFWKRAQ